MKFNSIAILGAGAVGSYLLWGLSHKENLDLCVIADGERKERFEKNGFIINGTTYHPSIKTPEEAHGVDLLILSVKYSGLPSALEMIGKIADEHTMVMSLMNGVDSEEKIGEIIPRTQIMPSFIKINSERRGNSINFFPEITIGMFYGESESFNGINGAVNHERLDAVAELLTDTGIHSKEVDDIITQIWNKFQLNVSWNVPQAIIGAGVGCFTDSEHALWLMQAMSKEVAAVASAKGITLPESQSTGHVGTAVMKTGRYSMLQDLDEGRHTEIDMFCGAVLEMGKELGIPTPYNEMALHFVKVFEEKNDGLFNF